MTIESFSLAMRRDDAEMANDLLRTGLRDPSFRRGLAAKLQDYVSHPRKFVETYAMLGPAGRAACTGPAPDWCLLAEQVTQEAVRNQGYRVLGLLLKEIAASDDAQSGAGVALAVRHIGDDLPSGRLIENFPQLVREIAPYPHYIAELSNIGSALRQLSHLGLVPHALDVLRTAREHGLPEPDRDALFALQHAALATRNAETIAGMRSLLPESPSAAARQSFTPP